MGLRKTIYVPEETWDFIQKNAKEENRSVSNYLVNKVMQRTIYVPTQEIWDSVVKAAAEQSVSSYLLGLHTMNLKARSDFKIIEAGDIRKDVVVDRDLMARADELVKGVEVDETGWGNNASVSPELEKAKNDHAKRSLDKVDPVEKVKADMAEIKKVVGERPDQDWRAIVKSRPKGQDGKKK